MKPILLGWLAAQGITLANDLPDQQILDALQKLFVSKTETAVTLGNERSTLTSKVTNLETERTGLDTKLTEAQTALATANKRVEDQTLVLANERKGHAAALVDLAIAQGKIAVADRDARITVLANAADLAVEADKLDKEPIKFAIVGGKASGERKPGADQTRSAREQVLVLANELVEKQGLSFSDAFNQILAKNPALTEQLKQKPA